MQFFAVLRVVENYPCLENIQRNKYLIYLLVEQIIYLFYQTKRIVRTVWGEPSDR